MAYSELDERTKFILKAIIEGYINSAEPVGSRTVSKKYHNLHLSPATIRNIMSDLEEMSYIEQPYTSAGRIPTDKGYRFFVDELSAIWKLSAEEISLINAEFNPDTNDIKFVLELACRVLSLVSRQAGVAHLHKFTPANFKHLEMIKIEKRKILVVFIRNSGLIQHKIVELEEDLSRQKIKEINHYLNREFPNTDLELIRKQIIEKMGREKEQYNKLLQKIIDFNQNSLLNENDETMYWGGTSNILDQPEFRKDIEQMKNIFRAFEEKSKIVKILNKCIEEQGINVIIGSENNLKEMINCSLITHTFKQRDKILGTLGIIGPRRMEYPRIIALVDYISNLVTKILSGEEFKS